MSKGNSEAGEIIKSYVSDRVTDKLNKQVEKHGHKLDELIPILDLWTRREPGSRKPRFSRDDIAAAALHIADTDGIDALSMRRLATELGAGTMTLYHYVRTKDELLSLLSDAVMGELVVSEAKLRGDWRSAITAIAHASRAALERHPWIFDVVEDPAIGPNGVKHFDQSWQAVNALPGTFADKLDVIHAVDEYVFGYVLHARNDEDDNFDDPNDPMRNYVSSLIETGDYATLKAMSDEFGIDDLWKKISKHAQDPRRFDRNLSRLLDGLERSLTTK